MIDPRVWTPDKTCIPFHLTGDSQHASVAVVLSWHVPSDHMMVITDYLLQSVTAGTPDITTYQHRRNEIWKILRQTRDTALTAGGNNIIAGISLRFMGALRQTSEDTILSELDQIGITVQRDGFAMPCRLMVPEGSWVLAHRVENGASRNPMARLNGYTFPLRPLHD